MSKRPSLSSLAPSKASSPRPAPILNDDDNVTVASTVASAAAPQATATVKTPAPYKAILSKVDDKTHKQLKRLAVDEGKPVGDLQIEALNLLFESRGLNQIAIRVTPDERIRK